MAGETTWLSLTRKVRLSSLLVGLMLPPILVLAPALTACRAPSPPPGDDSSPEVYVIGLFDGSKTTEEQATKLIAALPDVDWSALERKTGKAVDILSWLWTRDTSNAEELRCILRATKGLDGAMAEGYAGVVGRAYRKDSLGFVRLLAGMDPAAVDLAGICRDVAYDCAYYDLADIRAGAADLQDTPGLTDREKTVLDELLKAFDYMLDLGH